MVFRRHAAAEPKTHVVTNKFVTRSNEFIRYYVESVLTSAAIMPRTRSINSSTFSVV
jgi:hypothetical protein